MMGNTASSANQSSNKMSDKTRLLEMCRGYHESWEKTQGSVPQSELFRRIVPKDAVDFDGTFVQNRLNEIFTNPSLPLKVKFDYNCNHLYRDAMGGEMKLPIFSNGKYTVIQPMGEPGRDLGPGHSAKVSHLMVVTHSEDGPITFNEMLPSNSSEMNDFEDRISCLDQAYSNLKADSPVSVCGQKVIDLAIKMGVDPKKGIRSFMAHQIYNLSESDKKGPPGYKLLSRMNNDVCRDEGTILSMINDTFDDESLNLVKCIQPPTHNTQILSHMHGFMTESIPDTLNDNYIDCDVLLQVKETLVGEKAWVNESEVGRAAVGGCAAEAMDDDEGSALTRTKSMMQARSC